MELKGLTEREGLCGNKQRHVLEKKTCGCFDDFLTTTMFSSFLHFVAVLASVHSFTFVAATPEPQITQAPIAKRQGGVAGGSLAPILSTIHYSYSALPQQVYPYQALRGPQSGYNICNATTQGPDSLCQTLIVNDLVRLPFLNNV